MSIDFRSDTLTSPDERMRKAMSEAVVGDDVFMEDPTIKLVEGKVAQLTGKAGALFVPSGTMGNLIAAVVHSEGLYSEIMIGDKSHTALYEVGGTSIVARSFVRQLPNNADGTISLDVISRSVQGVNVHYTTTRALFLENTHNALGGKVLPLEYLLKVRELCDQHKIALHCDGARVWNAATALGVAPKVLLDPFDTASVCLSKALGAPVGSVVVGSIAFIDKARRARKMLGGGLRQAGILAAAGLFALDHMYERLREDHAMAATFAKQLTALGLSVVEPQSNIVLFTVGDAVKRTVFLEKCAQRGLKLIGMGVDYVRAIPHYGNTDQDVTDAVKIIGDILASGI